MGHICFLLGSNLYIRQVFTVNPLEADVAWSLIKKKKKKINFYHLNVMGDHTTLVLLNRR